MKKFFVYMLRHKRLYIFSVIMLLLGVAFDAMAPMFVQHLIDDVLIGGNSKAMMGFLFSLLGCFIMRGLCKYGQELSSDIVGCTVCRDARIDLFEHVEHQDLGFFQKNNPGELMSRIKRDTETVGFTLGFIGLFLFEIVIHVIVMLICLIRINLVLALVCMAFMATIGLISVKEEKKGDKVFEEISEETATMNQTASEAISGIRTVKAFNRQEHEKKRFEKRNNHFYNLSVHLEYLFSGFDAPSSFLGRAMLFFGVFVGGILALKNQISLGSLASAIEYIHALVWPMMELGWIINEISNAVASARKVKTIFDTKSPLAEGSKEIKSMGELEFSHVSLKFADTPVLDDVSFTLSKGKTLGIMGATGSGKTTITNLALRFMDPTSGTITMDGIPLSDLTFNSIRNSYAIVTQDIFLFSETVMENIKIGSQDMDDEKAIAAAKKARADSFIMKLEEGYSTVIGEKGVGLSGGQKQRLCIARALAKDAPVLILDDSTSALDMETEREIQHELRALLKQQSNIIVAHRISAVRRADEIIYLEKGKIVERGTHESLMALKGHYYETFVAQYSKEEADGCK